MKNSKINISLLFVEDEDETRKSIAEMIYRTIANLHVASNAIEALEIFEQYKPEIVLSDIKMPGMNGLQMIEKMKQINPQLKTIMMSAFTDTDFLLQAIKLQVDGFIVKPIMKAELQSAIKKQANTILLEKKVKKHKQDLSKSEENYRLLTEIMKDVIVKISTTGKVLYLSPAAMKFGGYNNEEEVGGGISKYFAEENDYQRAIKLIAEVIETHKSGNFEFMYKPKNKAPFPVELTYMPLIKDNKVFAIQLILRDISEHKEAERALQESEEKYRGVIENMIDGFYKTDVNGNAILFSPSVTNIIGFSEEEMIGKPVASFYANPGERNLFLEKIKKIGKVENYPVEIKRKGKSNIYIEANAQVIYKNGEYDGVEVVFRDVTERKKAEQALQESEIQLKELNATKDKFFSIIAHDLKSPFNSMLGFSEMLNNKFDKYDTKKKKKFINIIYQGLQDTFRLLENLLTWSRSQRGSIDFKPETLNLYLVAEETIDILSQTATNKSIIIKNEISESTFVKADKDMLATIIRNLVSNAIKFTPKGGKISIDAKNQQQFIEITVKDNGIGIPKEKQSQLFDIGENTSTQGTENETGTGLGLILCKEFVEKHGGKIWVESEIRKGSSFKFTIPDKYENANKNNE